MRKAGQITLILLIFLSGSSELRAQDRAMAQQDIAVLASDSFHGRGYIQNGDRIAAAYIARRLGSLGLSPVNGSYLQPFNLAVNTIPECTLSIDGTELEAGVDYMVAMDASSAVLEGKLFPISLRMLYSPNIGRKARKAVRKGWVPVIPVVDPKDSLAQEGIAEIIRCAKNKPLIFLKNSLVWSVGRTQAEYCHLWVRESAMDPYAEDVQLRVNAQLIPDYESQNVMGMIPGTEHPDSFIILCGHYDHLGQMGDAVYHGANDNASGIAMLLDMAARFADDPQPYSLLFVGFGGEEAGLVGSRYFVEQPPAGIELERIKFVFNMDLMGNGQEGATLVNGSVFTRHYDLFVKLNEAGAYLPKIKARGKAANSDHYFFTEAGIPSFFIYLMGPYTYYHIPLDNADELVLGPYYDRSFKLIAEFIIALNTLN